jgi:broad specificity phosphatase PhoE
VPAPPLTVIFARHGESQANIDRVFANRPEIPGDLTATGIEQARNLARMLAEFRVSHVYTSPLARARQTAGIVAAELAVPITVTDALREYDVGDFEGLPYTGDDHAWRWDRYMEVQRAWLDCNPDARHEGGESATDMLGRFLPFVTGLPARHDPDEVVVAVGHGGLYYHALPRLFPTIPPDYVLSHPLGYGDVVIGLHDEDGWRCASWGHEQLPIV